MKVSNLVGMVATLVLLAPAPAFSIGSITSGDVTFAYTDFGQGTGNTTNTDFIGAATGDQMYESWWFFRVSGDGAETAFAAPDLEDYSLGDYASLDWTDVAGRGLFDANLNVAVFDGGAVGGNLFQEMNITATVPLTLELFHYTDFDLLSSPGNDSASLDFVGADIQMTITEGVTSTSFIGYGADNYAVTSWRQLLNRLTNGNVTNLTDTGLPFGPGDFTGAYQWSLTLAAGETATVLTQFGTDAPLLPPTAMPTPEPGTGVLMGLGLVWLAAVRRTPRRQLA